MLSEEAIVLAGAGSPRATVTAAGAHAAVTKIAATAVWR
jgi:hypothetical protein